MREFDEGFEIREILPGEYMEAARIEQVCFPDGDAVPEDAMIEKAEAAPELFLVAADKKRGCLAGFLNGLATDEAHLRDGFYTDASLHDPKGENVVLLGLDVLPRYRGRHIATELMRAYARRERARGRKALILTCLKDRVDMYIRMGFEESGPSLSSWGGGTYREMVLRL